MNRFSLDWVLLTYTVMWSTSQCMKKEKPTIEEFAAKLADKQDNPTIHELAKAFPNKTYRELEKYRDADRQQESDRTPLTEAQQNLVDHLTESQKKQEELEPIPKGVCLTGALRKAREKKYFKEIDWEMKYDTEHKLRQEAEGETTIVKGIGQNSPEMKTLRSEVEALKQQLHTDREKYKKENNDLYNRIADALAINESHQKLNGKLQERVTELEEDNKKMHDHLAKQVESARKAGL